MNLLSETYRYLVFKKETGRLVQVLSCSPTTLIVGPDEDALPWNSDGIPDFNGVYVDVTATQLIARPELPARLEGDLLKGVPAGATIHVDGVTTVADGTDIELEFTLSGEYLLRIECWPYKTWRGVYEVTA